MRWKYIKIALLGAVLGLFGQMLADFFIPSYGFSDTGPENRKKTSLFQLLCEIHFDGSETRPYSETFLSKAEPLIAQGIALCWIARRSDVAFRTAAISALLLVAIVQTIEHFRRKKIDSSST